MGSRESPPTIPDDAPRRETEDDDAPVDEPSSADGGASSEAAATPSEPPALAPPKLFRELDRKGRLARAAMIAFTIYHLCAVVVGGGTKDIKRPFQYVFGFYDEGMRMTNSWGMFGKPPGATHVTIEGIEMDGDTRVLSTTNARERSFKERLRDVRIRKIQGKLIEIGERKRWGTQYLEWFCRVSKEQGLDLRAVRAVNHPHEVKDDNGKVKRHPSKVVLFTKSCTAGSMPVEFPEAKRLRERIPAPEADEGGL